MWDDLGVAAQFDCAVLPPPATTSISSEVDTDLADDLSGGGSANRLLLSLVAHLQSRGFFIVASGTSEEGVAKLYAFASGYLREGDLQPVFFLSEMTVKFEGGRERGSGKGVFECKSKCTDTQLSSMFIAKFNLGGVLSRA
jgi:hypothetical protein